MLVATLLLSVPSTGSFRHLCDFKWGVVARPDGGVGGNGKGCLCKVVPGLYQVSALVCPLLHCVSLQAEESP